MVTTHHQSENMLVRSEHLDKLLLLAGAVIVSSSNQSLAYRNLQALLSQKAPVDREVVENSRDLAETTTSISHDLHQLVQAIRTVSLKDFSFRARRLVRDLARKTGKRVRFEFEGEDTAVDKVIVEKLYDPISHQLRNALDHGIEDALSRTRSGKPEEGCIILRAYNTERETFVEIQDDGAGVDLEALRQKGIALGQIGPNDLFTEDDALRLMCMAGVSTARTISEVSGRGVGMDVVYSMITELGGTVSFTTQRGKGSIFTFRVPLVSAVNIVDALVVRAGEYLLAFPINSVVATEAVPRGRVNSTLGKGRTITYLGGLLPLHDLGVVIDNRPSETAHSESVPILIVEYKATRVAFLVSEFYSPQKLVIIPFEGQFNVPGITGTTILGGKQLGFIIDPPSLLDLATGKTSLFAGVRASGAVEERGVEFEPTSLPASVESSPVAAQMPQEETATEEPSSASKNEAAQEFLVEIEKMMPALNEAVFLLESNRSDTDLINNAFRLLHTIKGNFIMMGLPKAGETVHSVESVLDRARSHELDFTPEVMDVLMDGVSYIEEVVRQGKAGSWQDEAQSDIIGRTASLLPEPAPALKDDADVAASQVVLSHEASYRAVIHRRHGTPIYQCYVEFTAGMQPPFLVACLIYKRFCELGDVLGTTPPLPDVERGIMDGRFKLLLASRIDPDELEPRLHTLLTQHYGAKAVDITRYK